MTFIQVFCLPSDPIYHCTLSCILCFKELKKYCLNQVSHAMTKPTKWSESSLSEWRKLGSLDTYWAHSKDSDWPRLIWVFAGCTVVLLVLSCCGSSILLHSSILTNFKGEHGGSVVECRTPEREVGGSKPTAAVLCPWARHFTPRKYWLITQEAVAPSRHDWKIVDWDVKPQHKQTKQKLTLIFFYHCRHENYINLTWKCQKAYHIYNAHSW